MTNLVYERGDPDYPVGHAFLYFRLPGHNEVAATYIVVPPIALDFAKYVPPLLASSLGSSGLIAQTAFLPVPPAPEPFDLEELWRYAELRGDDVLDGGSGSGLDLPSLMARVAEVGDIYARAYHEGLKRAPRREPEPAPSDSLEGLALLYSILSPRERLEELARRVGTLRYAVEGGDRSLAESTRGEMRAIGAYLPAEYRVEELVASASLPDLSGARLAQLYIERGYKLCSGEHEAIASIDEKIALLQKQAAGQ